MLRFRTFSQSAAPITGGTDIISIESETFSVKIGQPIVLLALSAIVTAQIATPQKTKTPTTAPKTTKQTPATKPAAPAPAPVQPQTKPATPADVGADTVVVTINGVCPAATPTETCKRTITRAEFDRLVSIVNPDLPPESRRQLAALYVQLLTMANEAEKLSLDKDPLFAERLRLERLRLLAQAEEKKMQEGSKPSAQDVENFYAENSIRFEEYSLRRIVVPKTIGGEAKVAETKALADKIRARAAAGEDADKLEAEVYAGAKMPGAPPTTSLGWKRRGAMDPRHEPQIIQLKAGQLSEVIEDAQSYYIYKVDAKRIIPLATVKDDIERGLAGQNAENKIRALLGTIRVEMNDAFFGPPPAPPAAQAPASANPPKQ